MSLPTTDKSKERELNHVTTFLASNGYPKKLISGLIKKRKNKTVVSPEELVRSFFKLVEGKSPPAGIAVLPYIKGLTEPLARTLQKHDIKVYNKPVKTLERQFPSAKQKPPIEEQKNVVYQIPCQDCSWSYIGKTGRSLKARKSEQIRNVKQSKKGSNFANYTHGLKIM